MIANLKKKGILTAITLVTLLSTQVFAADHAEAPLVESDQGADIADVYAFLDPGDNSKVILAFDVHGFIVPGENGNFGGFDHNVQYRFNIDNTGDASPDKFISVNFSEQVSRSQPQTATVRISGKNKSDRIRFKAKTTVSSSTASVATTPVVTTEPAYGISFFAGLTDDPFFFDIPGFNRFTASVLAGTPKLNELQRGRDTFAGYNAQMIALSVPAHLLEGTAGSHLGISASTLRPRHAGYSDERHWFDARESEVIDRMGVPAINTVLIPFARKNEYNRATTVDDASGKFAGDIINTLKALGTDNAHIGILANVAVNKGDQLRLDTSLANSGAQGGSNPGAGFPNGRRPTDDVIDTILFLVTNEGLTTGDHVNANDRTFRNSFPFFAASNQPLPAGTVDDNTRN